VFKDRDKGVVLDLDLSDIVDPDPERRENELARVKFASEPEEYQPIGDA
jgi:hypothetical protein